MTRSLLKLTLLGAFAGAFLIGALTAPVGAEDGKPIRCWEECWIPHLMECCHVVVPGLGKIVECEKFEPDRFCYWDPA